MPRSLRGVATGAIDKVAAPSSKVSRQTAAQGDIMRTAEFIVGLPRGIAELPTLHNPLETLVAPVFVLGLAAGFVYVIHLIGKRL